MKQSAAMLSSRAEDRLRGQKKSPFPAPTGAYYDPILNPEGVINLSTAENSLLSDDVIPLLKEADLRPHHLKYRTTLLRSSIPQLADLLPKYVNLRSPLRTVTRENSVPGPGVGALLANLIWTLCDVGDGVLLSTPYYRKAIPHLVYDDYTRDILYPAHARPVFAHVPAAVDPLSPAVLPFLEDRIRSSIQEGTRVKVLILCNPHNPIPRCYPQETIEGYISLAEKYDLHLIVDEIFAHTVYATTDNPSPQAFISVLSLPAYADSPAVSRIHILAGPTKDLGCSGLKAALLISENVDVRKSVETALTATPISGIADGALSELLRDADRLLGLLEKNKRLLGQAMDTCTKWARRHNLPYVGANAGVYFILDLSPIARTYNLSPESDESVAELMRRMIASGVHINPTTLDLDPSPCRFRFIFTQKPDTLKLALHRLELAFELDPHPLQI